MQEKHLMSDFLEVVAQLKKFGVSSIRNGKVMEVSQLTKCIAFSEAKIFKYSIQEIFPSNYELCKQYVEKKFSYSWNKNFDDLLGLFLFISWEMAEVIHPNQRIKVFLETKKVSIQVIKEHYSQIIRVDDSPYESSYTNLEINCMNTIKEVYRVIKDTKYLTDVTVDMRIS